MDRGDDVHLSPPYLEKQPDFPVLIASRRGAPKHRVEVRNRADVIADLGRERRCSPLAWLLRQPFRSVNPDVVAALAASACTMHSLSPDGWIVIISKKVHNLPNHAASTDPSRSSSSVPAWHDRDCRSDSANTNSTSGVIWPHNNKTSDPSCVRIY